MWGRCGKVYGGECGKVRRGVGGGEGKGMGGVGKGRWGFEQVRGEVAYGKVHGVSVEKCVGEVRREVWGKVRGDEGV